MFPLTLFFSYTKAINIILVVAKNGYSVRDFSLFSEVSDMTVIAEINRCYSQIFPYINFLIKSTRHIK